MAHISVVFPFALPRLYTYAIPDDLADKIQIGARVEVELRQKLYSAVVYQFIDTLEEGVKVKPIISVIDDHAIVTIEQLNLWTWMAGYYCCTLGEVMEAGMPSGLKLHSESTFIINEDFDGSESQLSNEESLIIEALSAQKELSISQIQGIVNKKSVYPFIRSLLAKGVLSVNESLTEKYRPKASRYIALADAYKEESALLAAFDKIEKFEVQTKALLALVELLKDSNEIAVSDLQSYAKIANHALAALEKKGIVMMYKKNISRLPVQTNSLQQLPPLSEEQLNAITTINDSFTKKTPVLIHGVTGSGKTRLYMELIHQALQKEKQVLYLLPEIALTSQIVNRLYEVFGNEILLYHSKLNDQERVEIWNEVLKGKKLVLSARSGIFLPFINLDLIIVDEEHDASYKQDAPSPLYNARDIALYLSHHKKINIILGTATPSLETYNNVLNGKIRLVKLNNRYGDVNLPSIEVVDLVYERKTGRFKPVLSVPLQKAISDTLNKNKQVILFQNRRGYVPTIVCKSCGWTAMCRNCDVNLTYHKFVQELSCHYCNYKIKSPAHCPDCGANDISELGSGTEKIEEIVIQHFPKAKVSRLDLDAARTKTAQDNIINAFSKGEIDILVGTQMVTKGFDFDHVALVGVVDADAMIRFPDFRAIERTFQMITQVAGRAGRRSDQGKVIIQTYAPRHPVIEEIIKHDYVAFATRELYERRQFAFPPFLRLIYIELRHKEIETVSTTANQMAAVLKSELGERVQGPSIPAISRVRNQYIRTLLLKLEKDDKLINHAKKLLLKLKYDLGQIKATQSVRIKINVDPY